MQNLEQNQILNKKENFLKTIFPFYPVKFFSNVNYSVIISFMLALRIVLGFFNINLISFGISLSFAWLPIYIVGWFFGPIIGFFFGIATDIINYLINGGVWFWMYAIQELMIGIIAGCISILYHKMKTKPIIFDLIIQKIIIYSFALFSIIYLFIYFDDILNRTFSSGSSIDNIQIYLGISISFIIIFVIVIEVVNYSFKRNNFKNNRTFIKYKLFIYLTILFVTSTILMSFILGPITFIEFWKFQHNGSLPSGLIKYGNFYYLIPRILKETIKTPIYIILSFLLISIINPYFDTLFKKNKYKYQR